MRTPRRTDRHDKANNHFSQFCESAYKFYFLPTESIYVFCMDLIKMFLFTQPTRTGLYNRNRGWIIQSSGLLRGVRWFKTAVSGLHNYIIFMGQASWTPWPLKMGQIGSPETSVLHQLKPRNNPEEGIVYFNRRGSQRRRWDRGCLLRGTDLIFKRSLG